MSAAPSPPSVPSHVLFGEMVGPLARGGGHEEWLDAHVPDWGDLDPASLGERVTEHAEEAGFPQVFDDITSDTDRDHGRHDSARGDLSLEEARSRTAGAVSDDCEEVLEEARELTRRCRENAADGAADDSETE